MSSIKEITAPTPPVGVIESLAQGFDTVTNHLWLILIPLLLDVMLWAGPRLAVGPAIELMYEQFKAVSPIALIEDESAEAAWAMLDEDLGNASETLGETYQAIWLMPSVLNQLPAERLPFDYEPSTWVMAKPYQLLLYLPGSWVFSAGVMMLYLMMLAAPFRSPVMTTSRTLFAGVQGLIFLGSIPLLAIFLLMPFFLLGGMLGLLSGFLANMAVFGGMMLLSWVTLFAVFTLHGLLVYGQNLFKSLWQSMRIVQWNAAPTMTFFLLLLTINWGLTEFVWRLVNPGDWLMLVSVTAHAFVSTGVMTASFVFYKDRYRYFNEINAVLKEKMRKPPRAVS